MAFYTPQEMDLICSNLREESFLFLEKAEKLYGLRSTKFPYLGTIKPIYNGESSRTRPRYDRKCNVIYFREACFEDERQLIFELTHEIIHVLSGTDENGTIDLEEGLACYFSIFCVEEKYGAQGPEVWDGLFLGHADYKAAYENVKLLLECDKEAIKKLRGLPNIQGATANVNRQCFEAVELNRTPPETLIKALIADSIRTMHLT